MGSGSRGGKQTVKAPRKSNENIQVASKWTLYPGMVSRCCVVRRHPDLRRRADGGGRAGRERKIPRTMPDPLENEQHHAIIISQAAEMLPAGKRRKEGGNEIWGWTRATQHLAKPSQASIGRQVQFVSFSPRIRLVYVYGGQDLLIDVAGRPRAVS